ncbi:hypothetical protein L1887_00991 [Cichorium endivia]|nr:hypothetical protein L1887_00991 [Cichorium endivia]
MVFHFRCFSFPYVQDTRATNDDFHTANSHFDETRISQTPVPGLNVSPNLRVFTYSELKTATRNFDISSKLGEGGFAIVYKGTVRNVGNRSTIEVAVKQIKPRQQGYRTWVTEVNVLGEIDHDNLVKLIGFCNEDNQWLLVYEYMPKKSLDGHLSADSKGPPLSWDMRLKIAKDAAIGLNHLHTGLPREIVFRDFKPSNILLDNNWKAKLSDFGFARDGPQDGRTHVSTMVVGTKGYAAPEYVQTGRLTSKIDVWSYGIFLEELITGRPPIAQNNPDNDPQCLRWVCCYAGAETSRLTVDPRLQGRYSERSMAQVTLLAKKCLVKDPRMRPTMSQVLDDVTEAIALENQ